MGRADLHDNIQAGQPSTSESRYLPFHGGYTGSTPAGDLHFLLGTRLSSTVLSSRADEQVSYGSDWNFILEIPPRYFCAIAVHFVGVF